MIGGAGIIQEGEAELRAKIGALCSYGHRGSGTENEAKAASLISSWLRDIGADPEIQPIKGYRSWALSYILHLAVGIICLLFLPLLPVLTLGGSLLVLLSLLNEHYLGHTSLHRLLPRSPSQNVFAKLPFHGEPIKRILLVAHMDSQRAGLLWNEPFKRMQFGYEQIPSWLRNSFLPVLLGLVFQAVLASLALLGAGGKIAPNAEILFLCIYFIALVLMVNWHASPYVPGALDNASGVVSAISICQQLIREPIQGLEIWVLFTRCEETGLGGAFAWASRNVKHRADFEFINLDSVGAGQTRIFEMETPIVGPTLRYPLDLLCQAQEVLKDLGESSDTVAFPGPTDGLAFLKNGFRGITICSLSSQGTMPNYHQMSDTPENVDYTSIAAVKDFTLAFINESLRRSTRD